MLQLPQLCHSCLLTCSVTSLCCNCLSSVTPVYLPVHSSVLQLPQLCHSCLLTCSLTSLCCNCLSSLVPVYLTKLLKVYKPTHQLCSFYDTSILSSLCVHTLTWPEIFFLCSTVCLEQSPFQSLVIKHTHIFQIIFEISPLQAVLLTLCVCMHFVSDLHFVMGYVFQFGPTAHITIKRVHHYYVRLFLTVLPLFVANSSTRDGFVYSLWSCECASIFGSVFLSLCCVCHAFARPLP